MTSSIEMIKLFTTQHLGQIIALLVLVLLVLLLARTNASTKNNMNLSDLFMNPTTDRIDGSKLRMNLAFFVTSWVVVYATLNEQMSEWLFIGYLTAWVADRKFSRDTSVKLASSDNTTKESE